MTIPTLPLGGLVLCACRRTAVRARARAQDIGDESEWRQTPRERYHRACKAGADMQGVQRCWSNL